jgi:prefoldin subunit 5
MSFSVVFRRIAKQEFDDAISWYQDRHEGLGRELALLLNDNLQELRFRHTSLRV